MTQSRQDRNRYAAQDLFTFDIERRCSRLLSTEGSGRNAATRWHLLSR